MKHKSSRELYRYWTERRGHHLAPERADIDPTAIPRVLADTFLLAADRAGELVVRLAGTRVCALFCREIKGEAFVGLFAQESRSGVADLLAAAYDEATVSVAGVAGRSDDGAALDLELLLLPLRHRGRMDSRALGVLAPLAPAYWIGTMPLVSVVLGTVRYMRSDSLADAPQLVPLPSVMRTARLRRGLMVLDGGRDN